MFEAVNYTKSKIFEARQLEAPSSEAITELQLQSIQGYIH